MFIEVPGIETQARDAAIAVSLAVQHGTPADTLRRALTRDGTGRELDDRSFVS
jgi:hypothetical protein